MTCMTLKTKVIGMERDLTAQSEKSCFKEKFLLSGTDMIGLTRKERELAVSSSVRG